jgi:hypothetical protein
MIVSAASPSFAIPFPFAVLFSFPWAKLSLEATGCNSKINYIISYMQKFNNRSKPSEP